MRLPAERARHVWIRTNRLGDRKIGGWARLEIGRMPEPGSAASRCSPSRTLRTHAALVRRSALRPLERQSQRRHAPSVLNSCRESMPKLGHYPGNEVVDGVCSAVLPFHPLPPGRCVVVFE
jgi:hypothetical protein